MHVGIVAANTPWPRFLEVLSRHTGDFVEEGAIADMQYEELEPRDEGFTVIGGEFRGNSYLLDSSFILSMAAPDLLAEISKEAGLLVVGCGAETVSGSFEFLAVRSGELLRLFHHCHASLKAGLEVGAPLSSEREHPLEDLDGRGLMQALAQLGFDYDGWIAQGSKTKYLYTARELHEPAADRGGRQKGPLRELVDRHDSLQRLAKKDAPPLVIVTRDAKTGKITDVKATSVKIGFPRKKSWIRRLFGRGTT
jgi:hypothetical protein